LVKVAGYTIPPPSRPEFILGPAFGRTGGPGLNQFEAQFASEHGGGALQGRQRDVAVVRVEQAADLAAACSHPLGHALARQALGLHRLFDLPGQNFLDGDGRKRLARAFRVEKAIERRRFLCTAWFTVRQRAGAVEVIKSESRRSNPPSDSITRRAMRVT
jgi:hypothetical protein